MINKVILIGRLGADPEIRYTPKGVAVANFRIATNEVWTNQDGEREERTEWHRIVTFGNLAETCSKYLAKGRQVYVEGRLRTREWEDKDGNRRWTTEIVANTVKFLGGRGEELQADQELEEKEPLAPGDAKFPDEDDLPF